MKAIFLVLGVVLVLGLAAAYVADQPHPAVVEEGDARDYFDQSAAIEDRILALERAVAEERDARQLLEDELQALYAEIDALASQPDAEEDEAEEAVAAAREIRNRFNRPGSARSSVERRVDGLVSAGLSQDRAEWIVKRENELQLEAMQARFEARRTGEPVDRFDPAFNPGAALRAELGDAEYEQYLAASGRSTSVSINSVMESSPAAVAGLQPGDRIVSYDGQRVFNTFELNMQTMRGTPGDTVVVDILRDGAPMQVVVPRGPVGIYTRDSRRRR